MNDLLLDVLSNYGLHEVAGSKSNPFIIKMGKELGVDIEDDSTFAWCSLALSYFAKRNNYEYNKQFNARGWLKIDKPIIVLKPSVGDIVVLWRVSPDSWEGHVGIFINWDETNVWVLGGNQGNMISIAPYKRERILGFRQLHKLSTT